MKIWDTNLGLSQNKVFSHRKHKSKITIKKQDTKIQDKIVIPRRPSSIEIRNKLIKKFGKSDVNGEFRLSKVRSLAKKTNEGTYALQNALQNGTVNFSEKEKEILSKILGKNN